MSHTERELRSQPSCWTEASRLAPLVADALPAAGERVLAIGCGTSFHVALAYAATREAAGLGETDAAPASEAPHSRKYDRVVAISRSGTTTEVARYQESWSGPSTALVAVGGTPVAERATRAITLAFADEESVVQTRFATSALALLRAHNGEDLSHAIVDAESAIDEPLSVDPADFNHFVFLGHGWSIGLAHEAALKVREASCSFSESWPAMEYRHGPISLAGTRSLVWALGDVDTGVMHDVRNTGATVITSNLDAMAELIRVQRFAVVKAEAKGLDPDRPHNLTRSVILS